MHWIDPKGVPRGWFPAVDGLKLGENELTVTKDLTEAQYDDALGKLASMDKGARFWIGDLLVARGKRYGETYDEAARITGRSVSTLSHWRNIAWRIEPAERFPQLRWSHYRELVRLGDDDREWYTLCAAEEGWTAKELREQILRDGGRNDRPKEFPKLTPRKDEGHRCPTCGQRWPDNVPVP